MKFWSDIIDHAQIRRPLAGASTLYGAPMNSTLAPKTNDDPHDVVVVAPDAVGVAPSHDEISELLRGAARHRADVQASAVPDSSAGPAIPLVDTTFRPAALDVEGPSMVRRLARGFVALLLAACIGGGALVWKAYGDAATKQIAKLATQVVMMVTEKPAAAAQAAPPPVQADATNTAAPAPVAAETAPSATDPAQPSTARDLASLTQQVEQLKASIEQLKASQQQMSRDLAKTSEVRASEAKVSEQNLRPKIPAPPPHRVAARTPRPLQPYAPPPAAAPYAPQATYVAPAAAPYVPRQPDYAVRSPEPPPLTTGQSLTDPELSSVPRPPMPLR
jgi:hypothetical protein